MRGATLGAGRFQLQAFLRCNVRFKNGLQCFVCKHESVTAVILWGGGHEKPTLSPMTAMRDAPTFLPILTILKGLALA